MAWTYDEKQYLIENIGIKTVMQIAKDLNKNKHSVYQMSYKLGVSLEGNYWSKKDERYLISNWDKFTLRELAFKLCKSIASVRSKAYRLGLKLKVREYRLQEVANLLGTSRDCIKYYADRGYLGTIKVGNNKNGYRVSTENQVRSFMFKHQNKWCSIKGHLALELYETYPKWLEIKIEKDKLSKGLRNYRHWTNEEDKLLSEIYPQFNKYSIEDIADIFGRSSGAIINRARLLFLERDFNH